MSGTRYDARWLYAPTGAQGDSPGQSEAPPWVWYATKVACPERAEQADKSVPGTRCGARSDASKQAAKSVPGTRRPNRCQAPGATPGQMLANRWPRAAKSVPGTRCGNRSDASKQAARSVPGTRCGARSDASKQAAQIGARHELYCSAWHELYCSPVVATCRTSHLSPDGGGLTRAAVHRLAADG